MVGSIKGFILGISGLALLTSLSLRFQNPKFSEKENLENKTINYSINDSIKKQEEKIILKRKEFVENARKYLGKEYQWGGRLTKENPGIEKAILSTVHGYTATQNVVDSPVKDNDFRRGRAAAQNIVPSTTGAALAVVRALPEFKDKFDGIAMRVPVPAGSVADITFISKGFLDEAKKAGWDAKGVDLSAWASKYARENFGIEIRQGTLEQAAFPHAENVVAAALATLATGERV